METQKPRRRFMLLGASLSGAVLALVGRLTTADETTEDPKKVELSA